MRFISIIISLLLILSCAQSPVYAQTFILSGNIIPADLAQVSDAFFKGERLVVNIQDLHSHEETQRNISAVLSYLDAKYKIDNIYVEGAVGEIDSAWLKNIKKTSYGEAVIERLMKDARLSGAEYFALQSERGIVLKGLENEKLYIENLKRLKEIYAVRNEAAANLDELRAGLKNLSKTALSSNSRKHISFFEKRRKDLDEKYFKYLLSAANSANVSLSYYPQIANYLELAKLQRKIDYKKSQSQINSFLNKLKEVLPYKDYKKLMEAQYKDEFYVNLSKFYDQYKPLEKYSALEKFFTLIRLKQSVNFADLISEQKR
ncbi:MAG: hypothetical protein LBL00_05270, partial [Endomicrobium sp.]|nr:hypothetical protein [Endomicrobium sp.]